MLFRFLITNGCNGFLYFLNKILFFNISTNTIETTLFSSPFPTLVVTSGQMSALYKYNSILMFLASYIIM